MAKLKVGQSSAVFFLFFLLALIEAVGSGNWLLSLVFVFLGLLSMRADATAPPGS
jgi:hypothetical protein